MNLTQHAEQRLRERGLTQYDVLRAVSRGEPEESHGAVRVRWHDIVVVCAPGVHGTLDIITAYRSTT